MSFTYSDNPASNQRDAIRFMAGDTEEVPRRSLTDNEIRFVAARYGLAGDDSDFDETATGTMRKMLSVAAECCEMLAGRYSADAAYSVGGMNEQVNQRASQYRTRARQLRAAMRRAVGIKVYGRSISDKETAADQTDLVQSIFKKEMFDNEDTETF